jgi:hypothetical protein
MANVCERFANDPKSAVIFLRALAGAIRSYAPQTHVETYALESVMEDTEVFAVKNGAAPPS